MFRSYINAVDRLRIQLEPISRYYQKPTIIFWIDAILAHFEYGVTPNQYIGYKFYKLNRLERKRFYTLRHANRFEKFLNDPHYSESFWNKAVFNKVFHDFIRRDWMLCTPGGGGGGKQVKEFLESHKKVMVKPLFQSSGTGIHVYKDDRVEDLLESNSLLEEFVIQHHEIALLNPTSVNTVRIYTMIDRNKSPNILTASLRVGGKDSEVDNYHSGGVGYPVDIESGLVMGAGVDLLGGRHLIHPGTDFKVVGFSIPNWKELLEFVKEASLIIPSARLIAWDIAILEDGFELIEGNYEGDPGFMQTPSGEGMLPIIKSMI